MQTEQINQEVLVILLKRIIDLLDKQDEPDESLKADEVRAALRNELAGVIKAVKSIPEVDNSLLLKEIKSLKEAINSIEINPSINVAGAEVTIPEIKLPQINIPEFNIPTPQVNYTPPDIHIDAPIVNVPAPIVNVPEIEIDDIIKELRVGLEKLRTNNKSRPLAVRLSDGADWIKELKKQGSQITQFLSDVSYIKDSTGKTISPATSEGQTFGKIVPYAFDYVELSPASLPTTLTFKQGGSSGTTVSTVNLVYSNGNVSTITRV